MAAQLLQGKRALVTGASSGLGLSMAEALAEAGATVGLTARSVDRLDTVVARLSQRGLDVHAQVMDVRDEQSIAIAVDEVRRRWGGLDLLVNNAGIGMRTVNPDFLSDPQPFYRVSAAAFRDLIDTNLTGYFLVAKAFMALFLEQRRGKIVNITMNHATMCRKGFVPYGPSRAGAESLSLIMAEDLREANIDVNMLLPGGATETGMIPEQHKEAIKAQFNLLSPDVMAEPIVFLASDASDGLTGERIVASEFDEWRRQRKR
ncbi:SDR family NAD(P)-dependent oxidoreductase [Stutzerimonas kunmingensis]|jgi:gluconate 5-dehydrogenase|uniref:SDR family NAD(P)-dependent oxidoreductase n=1 Tax=Stutzerimonas kunmingensis TaxID=1211807 RepID=UPI000CE2C34B|nr:SDR family oxidoreductase [Stutzerimonas kunmingensis]